MHASAPVDSRLRRVRERLQLDRPLAVAVATRIWQAISGPITIVLLIKTLSQPETGIYYALVGIIGIQAYFELGLLNVLVSQSGHAMAAIQQAESQDSEDTSGEKLALAAARMRDLIRSSLRWFTAVSVLFAISALIFGWCSLSASVVEWQGPLLALVPLAACTVAVAPAISILEGAGFRDLVYRFRFIQMLGGSLVVWLALVIGWKLWALVASSAVQAMIAGYIVYFAAPQFFNRFRSMDSERSSFDWMREVLPVQWRVALIGATYHFATQFFVIIVVTFHSDAEAGPLGMTLSVTTAIQMLALAWVQTKFPIVAAHHGAGEREKAGTLWRQTALVSTSLLLLGLATLIALIYGLPWLPWNVASRFLEPWQVIVLAIGCVANHIAAVQGFYVLSRGANPLLAASLVGCLVTAAAVWIGGYAFATDGVLIGYAVAMALVFVPAHTLAYMRFRQRTDATVFGVAVEA